MDILSYVAALIQTHKQVGIPQLGTFFKRKSPGRYDAQLHTFLPPSYQLDFKQELHEENALVEYIAKQHNLSAESARYHVDKFAEELNSQLTSQQQADLQSLGKLSITDGKLHFKANPDLNLGYEFFGLPPVHEDKVVEIHEEPAVASDPEKLEAIIIENEMEEENPGNMPQEEIVTAVVPPPFYAAEDTKFQQEIEVPKRGMPTYAKVIIAILILLIAALGWFLYQKQSNAAEVPSNDDTTSSQQMPVDSISRQDSIPVDTTQIDSNLSVDVPAVKLSTDTLTTSPVVAASPALPTTYEVIGSSVYGEKEAAYFIATMKKKWGINAKIVSQRPGKKIKISIATYKDEKKARLERGRLEEKINIPGLYIYVNTHKPE